ncbi:MAG: hypothetical protein CUN49_13100, partial [Candidatus Thermofonsia Clade 1 bacterium]
AAEALVAQGGLAGLLGAIFGAGFIAELPRAVVLLIANVVMFAVATQLLHRYGEAQRAKLGVRTVQPMRAAAMASD